MPATRRLARRFVPTAFTRRSSRVPVFFQHGHTYLGHPTACAGGLAVLSEILDNNLVERVQQQGHRLQAVLQDRFGGHPNVGDIRGRGLFIGLEFVSDRDSKTAFDPQYGINRKFKQAAVSAGLICYPMGGTIDGRRGDHVLLAPPFIIEDDHINEIVDKLDQALITTLASL